MWFYGENPLLKVKIPRFNGQSFRQDYQKTIKKSVILNDTLDQLCLICIRRTLHPKTGTHSSQEYMQCSSGCMLGHKTSLNKFKRTEIISSIFSDYSIIKLQVSFTGMRMRKNTNRWRLKNMLLKKKKKTQCFNP